MKEFLGANYLLSNGIAQELYEDHAKAMPIYDFHCHLQPKDIYEDTHYDNLTQCWIILDGHGDHYKWRLMREAGIDERFITGDASDKEKFLKFCEAMPSFLGNPIYEWAHLELRHYFGIKDVICSANANKIWDAANQKLETIGAREMMRMSHVEAVFTTDDPLDDLHYHELLAKDTSFPIEVHPCWRPDAAINIEKEGFLPWEKRFEALVGRPLLSLQDFLDALDQRLAYFVDHGALASDHSLEDFRFKKADFETAQKVYMKALYQVPFTLEEADGYKGYLLQHLGEKYYEYSLVQQYHIGALRNVASRRYQALGSDAGYDTIRDPGWVEPIAELLNSFDAENKLPKTILYNLNAKDDMALAVLANSFPGVNKGQVQLGAAWWFNDSYPGIKARFELLANTGLLSNMVGMVTDSRSFLSYPRHDYFRRILCSYIASLVEEGRYPDERACLGKMVEDICYNNAKAFFAKTK